jgi:hypothetical protein
MFGGALAALMLAGAATRGDAAAPARSPVFFEVDARVELGSAILMLSEAGDPSRGQVADDSYAREARASFGKFSQHPAVARAARLERAGTAPEALMRLMFLLSPLPELAPSGPIPEDVFAPLGGKDEAAALLSEVRDFARLSNFKKFFEAHRAAYAAFVDEARLESLRAISPEAAAAYLGRPFEGEHHFILAPLLHGEAVDEPIVRLENDDRRGLSRVFHLRPRVLENGARGFQFDSFGHSVAYALSYDSMKWVKPSSSEQRALLADAVGLRVLARDLGEDAFRDFPRRPYRGADPSRLEMLCERLKGYERDRARYPTLADFYPRLTASVPTEDPLETAPNGFDAKSAIPTSSTAVVEIGVDARIELLGVIALLAGSKNHDEALAAYRAKAESRFASFRNHPAVLLYQDILRTNRESFCSAVLLYYSAPPELAFLNPGGDIPHLGEPREQLQQFLWELRQFAQESDFMDFFRENREYYETLRLSVSKKFEPQDPVAELERYLGLSLSSRVHYILPLLYGGRHAYIVPYPEPSARSAGIKAFQVYSNIKNVSSQNPDIPVWNEMLYVFMDPSSHYFESLNVSDPAAFYGPDIAKCRLAYSYCAKDYVAAAIIARLKKGDPPRDRYVKALWDRLAEYEGNRHRYPTLWDFYPRLFSVYHELAFPGAPPLEMSMPADPRIQSATDFFDPVIVGKLERASLPAPRR